MTREQAVFAAHAAIDVCRIALSGVIGASTLLASGTNALSAGIGLGSIWCIGFFLRRREAATHDEKFAQIYDMIKFDGLTGALNRTFFLDTMRASQTDGYLMIADADHFKAVNDQHGHYVGDAVLIHLSNELVRVTGSAGFVGRLGGEEFGIYLPDATYEAAARMAEDIRQQVEASAVCPNETPITMTLSIGGARHRRCEPVGKTFKLADKNLYAAKSHGRNRVMFSPNLILDWHARIENQAKFDACGDRPVQAAAQ